MYATTIRALKEKIMKKEVQILDMDGRELQIGHLVAVRYCWNSYVGYVRLPGLSLCEGAERFFGAASYHRLEQDKTYQILSHEDKNHPDYNNEINYWHATGSGDCPVKIRVYENVETF